MVSTSPSSSINAAFRRASPYPVEHEYTIFASGCIFSLTDLIAEIAVASGEPLLFE